MRSVVVPPLPVAQAARDRSRVNARSNELRRRVVAEFVVGGVYAEAGDPAVLALGHAVRGHEGRAVGGAGKG